MNSVQDEFSLNRGASSGNSLSLLALIMSLVFVALSAALKSQATPMTGTGGKGVLHWAKGTTIKVWVPDDPDAVSKPARRSELIEGIKAWGDLEVIKALNIEIQIVDANPGILNAIHVAWRDSGSMGSDFGGGYPAAGPDNVITFARIDIDRIITQGFAYNLAQHEMVHALGLKDSGSPGDVMCHQVTASGHAQFTPADKKELSAAYTASLDQTRIDFSADILPLGANYIYQYTADWLGGGSLAVFQVDTHGAPVFDIVPPLGWMVDDFSYSPDGTPTFTGSRDDLFLSFIHQADDTYLDADHPTLTFQFTSSSPPVRAEAFLNGYFETVGPVPEPSTGALASMGFPILLAGAWCCRQIGRRRRPPANSGYRPAERGRPDAKQ